jgi:hypothetical protein
MKKNGLLLLLLLGGLGATLTGPPPTYGVGHALARPVSENPADSTPHVLNGRVLAIAPIGNRVYVGGTFTAVRSARGTGRAARRYLFAYNADTGRVLPGFRPRLDRPVESIAPGPGRSIIVAGRFHRVDGRPQHSLARLTPDGRRVRRFVARTDGPVEKVLVRGKRLFAAGRFRKANGAGRSNFAAFDARTGRLSRLNIPVTQGRVMEDGTETRAEVVEMDANRAGTRLVLIGNFRRVGSRLRQQIAMIDLRTNRVTPWATDRFPNDRIGTPLEFGCGDIFGTEMRDVEFSPDGRWFAVVTAGGAWRDTLCDTVSRWEVRATAPAEPTWFNCTGGDTLLGVAVTSAAVYAGGHQRWMSNCEGRNTPGPGAIPREGIAALSPSGEVLDWNPGRDRGIGTEELVATRRGLYVGSDTEELGGEFHGRLGLFPAR